jgi:hypothetical protein
MKHKRNEITRALTIEAWLFVAVGIGSVWLYQSDLINGFLAWSAEHGPLPGALAAGVAFSTFVTTPFAIATFAGIGSSITMPIWQIALVGALGATLADLFIVRWTRSPISLFLVRAIVGHDAEAFKKRVKKWPGYRWVAALVGGFLVGIPLPTDEVGLVFFSASGLRLYQITPLIFVADFVGVYALVAAAGFLAG